jgi:subtilisin family serine protease
MLNRAHSRLTLCWLIFLFIIGIALPLANTQDPGYPTIVGLSADRTIREFAERNDLRVLDSAGNHHLVLATTEDVERLAQQPGVDDVETDFAVGVSELGLAGDTTALLNPNTVAVLNTPGTVLHGGGLIKESVVRQAAINLIENEYEDESHVGSGRGTRVAVIDTGIDWTHPALSGRVLPGVNVVDGGTDTEDPLPSQIASAQLNSEIIALLNPNTVAVLNPNTVAVLNQPQFRFYGHGTIVGGLIHTVAPDAWLVPFKAFTASGMTSSFTVAKAIRQATDMNVDVINMSFDFDRPSSVIREALDYAASRGIVLIASAGNGGKVAEVYPAIHPAVIAVASTDMKDRKASFSNYGPAVSVSAPGDLLLSTYPGNQYAAVAGTSFSAALVSGEAARIRSLGPITADETRARIRKAVKRIGDLNPGIELGTGRIKVHSALESDFD